MKYRFLKYLIISLLIFRMINPLVHGLELEGSDFIQEVESKVYFEDIEKDDFYFKELNDWYQEGYLNGIGENIFGKNRNITLNEYISLIDRSYKLFLDIYEKENLVLYTQIDLIKYKDYNSYLEIVDYFKSLFYLFGIPTAEIEYCGGVLNTAKKLNLIPLEYNDKFISRELAIGSYIRLKEGGKKYLFNQLVGEIKIINSKNKNLEPLYDRLSLVPISILELFIQEGWTINYVCSDNRFGGLTDYDLKTITIYQDDAVVHEFGHFFDNVLKKDDFKHKELYKKEKNEASKQFDSYCKTNDREFFADMFKNYIYELELGGSLDVFNSIPLTLEYFNSLNSQYNFSCRFSNPFELLPVQEDWVLEKMGV